MSKRIWLLWGIFCIALTAYFLRSLFSDDGKSVYLIGDATYGHYQIEMACETCHSDPFGGEEVLQNACTQCHAEELEEAHDSHPKSKFTDPREAYRLEKIDARYCVSCHVEHQTEQTHAMGVTLPDDYCYHCHIETVEQRESHKDLAFDSCADAGCHNYHDNRALYESFLVKNAGMPWLSKSIASTIALPESNYAQYKAPKTDKAKAASSVPTVPDDWHNSSHQLAGVSCESCHTHTAQSTSNEPSIWIDKPNVEQCQSCHMKEAMGFKAGKHGMKLIIADYISNEQNAPTAITPAESPLEFNQNNASAQHGCNSCHAGHQYDTQFASVEACLNCHIDEHSLSYEASPHGQHRNSLIKKNLPLSNVVSCSSCHMPRIEAGKHQLKVGTTHANSFKQDATADEIDLHIELYRVQHNQNWNLRPNEKMIRPVCMSCHSLEFSIDALADPALIENNFNGQPNKHIESIDWAVARDKE